MATGPRYRVRFRRRREGKTDYRARKNMLRSGLPRAVVRLSSKYVTVQLIQFTMQGDRVLASASSRELEDMGWKRSKSNTPSAYLTGMLAGKRALENDIDEAVLDIGLKSPVRGTKMFGALKGLVDAGLYIPHDESVLPDEPRLRGEHMGDDVPKMFDAVVKKLGGEPAPAGDAGVEPEAAAPEEPAPSSGGDE